MEKILWVRWWRWVRQFNQGRENVYDEEPTGRLLLIINDLVCDVAERIRENSRLIILKLSMNFTTSENFV